MFFLFFIGIAEAIAAEGAAAFSGEGDIPAGEAIEEGKM